MRMRTTFGLSLSRVAGCAAAEKEKRTEAMVRSWPMSRRSILTLLAGDLPPLSLTLNAGRAARYRRDRRPGVCRIPTTFPSWEQIARRIRDEDRRELRRSARR